MSDEQGVPDWREQADTVLRAVVVVTCYVIVFTGLLMTVASAGQ